jgi:hypothetical protein
VSTPNLPCQNLAEYDQSATATDRAATDLFSIFSTCHHFITADAVSNPHWQTIKGYKLTTAELLRTWADIDKLIGIRPQPDTQYLFFDIDRASKYHFLNDRANWDAFLYRLELIGLTDPIFIRSSASLGVHIYYVFNQSLPTFKLAATIHTHLTKGGFHLKAGQIESFPNAKAYNSNYQAHRLPFQADSILLDSHGDELISPHNLTPQTRMHHLASQVENNTNDLKLLKSKLNRGHKTYQKNLYRRYGTGKKRIDEWERDWRETIELGWLGKHQTNDLLKIIVGYAIVFDGITDPHILFDRVKAQAINAPGYRQYCGHQHEIDKRIWDWINLDLKRKYYTPLLSHPARLGEYPGRTIARYKAPKRTKKTQRTNTTIERIQAAIDRVIEQLGALPQKLSDRWQAIVAASKQLGAEISKNTLYKACYKYLWRSAETAETRQSPETETEQPLSQFLEIEESPILEPEIQSEQALSHEIGPMKRYLPLGGCVTDLGVELESLSEGIGEKAEGRSEEVDLSVPVSPDLESDCGANLHPETELAPLSAKDLECDEGSRTEILPPSPKNRTIITSTYIPNPAAPPPATISNDYRSPEVDDDDDGEPLPQLGDFVVRIEHFHRGTLYPEVIARVVGYSGTGWEVISNEGRRYRFDRFNWMDTWCPLRE